MKLKFPAYKNGTLLPQHFLGKIAAGCLTIYEPGPLPFKVQTWRLSELNPNWDCLPIGINQDLFISGLKAAIKLSESSARK